VQPVPVPVSVQMRAVLAPRHVAMGFAVEHLFHPAPLGLHKPFRFISPLEMRVLLDGVRYSVDSQPDVDAGAPNSE
jgi:hypothetical protein